MTIRTDSIVVRLSWPVPDGANEEAWEQSKVADRLINGNFGIRSYYSYMPLTVEVVDLVAEYNNAYLDGHYDGVLSVENED